MKKKISEFEKTFDSIYGVYLDAYCGFVEVKKRIEESQIKSIHQLKNINPEMASVEFVDTKAFVYGDVRFHLSTLKRTNYIAVHKVNSNLGILRAG